MFDDINAFLVFLASAVTISLSGVMAPGPMTAAAVASGSRLRHAGALIALGHAVVEMPLIVLLIVGLGERLERPDVKIGIGLAGGAFLLLLAFQMIMGAVRPSDPAAPSGRRHPFITGILFSAGNPYFLIWWATVGLALASRAVDFGILAFGLFAVVHWLCDLVWFEALSLASFRGSKLLGPLAQRIILALCAAALLAFGASFIRDAAGKLFRPA